MKARMGFVSNSSSSSFTCDVCNVGETIDWEAVLNCPRGHGMHMECAREALAEFIQTETFTAWLRKNHSGVTLKEVQEALDEGCCWPGPHEIVDYFWQGQKMIPEELCPVCNMHALPEWALIRYCLHRLNMSQEDVLEHIRRQYKDYAEIPYEP